MIDSKALADMSYGLFVVSSLCGEKINALVANSVFQVTAQPPKIAVALNKNALTHEYIECSKKLCIMPIAQGADMMFVGNFGFRTGRNFDKFAKIKYKRSATGLPVVLEHTLCAIEVEVSQIIDLGTHTMFIGPITDTEVLSEGKPLTYDYYQCVLKGKTPEGATTFKGK